MLLENPGFGEQIIGEVWRVNHDKLKHLGKLTKIFQKGIDLNHDFYVVVGKQYRTENVYTGHQHNIQGVHCDMLESKCIFWAEKLFSQA